MYSHYNNVFITANVAITHVMATDIILTLIFRVIVAIRGIIVIMTAIMAITSFNILFFCFGHYINYRPLNHFI